MKVLDKLKRGIFRFSDLCDCAGDAAEVAIDSSTQKKQKSSSCCSFDCCCDCCCDCGGDGCECCCDILD